MKTTSLSLPPLHFIDTAPLAVRYRVLMTSVMAMITAGRDRDMLRLSYRVARLVKLFIRLDTHNRLLERKLSMLSNSSWRTRVLKELGGMRKLKLWDAAQERIRKRVSERALRKPKPVKRVDPSWCYRRERLIESERLKADARFCAKACVPPRTFRDRAKMDFEGEFRLAPLPRNPRAKGQIRIYSKIDICEYRYNAMPFGEVTGLGPATVWPVEFYAAILAENEKKSETNFVIPDEVHFAPQMKRELGPNPTCPAQPLGPRSAGCALVGDDRGEACNDNCENLIPLRAAIDRKTYRALFAPV